MGETRIPFPVPHYAPPRADGAPRGLASNSGFEDREAIEAKKLATVASQMKRALEEIEKLASVIWEHGLEASPCHEQAFIDRMRAEFIDAAITYCKPNTFGEAQ